MGIVVLMVILGSLGMISGLIGADSRPAATRSYVWHSFRQPEYVDKMDGPALTDHVG
jgi:hypothetical protein